MKKTYGISCKHLDFISYEMVKDGLKGWIYIYSHKRNGKIRKKKVDNIGGIAKHFITKKWSFCPNNKWCFSAENMRIITDFMNRLETGLLKLNSKGELEIL